MKWNQVSKVSPWVLLAMALSAGCAGRTELPPRPTVSRPTSPPVDNPTLVELFIRGEFTRARARFDPVMKARVPVAALKRIWESRARTYGGLQQHRLLRRFARVIYACKNTRQHRAWSLAVDRQGQIVGIHRARPEPQRLLSSAVKGPALRALRVVAPFMRHLQKRDFRAARSGLSQRMRQLFTPHGLARFWSRTAPVGVPTRCGLSGVRVIRTHLLVYKRATFRMNLIDDHAGRLAGIRFQGVYRDPAYANKARYVERPTTVGKAPWQLPGILTMPRGPGGATAAHPVPAVVLVHGSGPGNRDASVGASKPFRDLALGLASRGIAVLRYDKRTLTHRRKVKGWPTLDEETVDDAVAAVALLRRTRGIDPKRIYVAGLSMGGFLVPRIGLRDKRIAGFVVLAGSTQPLEDVIAYQTEYLFQVDGRLTAAERRRLAMVRKQAARVKAARYSLQTPARELLGIPPSRWQELRKYKVLAAAKRLSRPLLVLQGKRDYQVTMKDFAGWKQALTGKPWVTFRTFARLNHRFIAGRGPSTPAEYGLPGNVSLAVLQTIVRFIQPQATAASRRSMRQ